MAKVIYKQEMNGSSTFARFELSRTEQPPPKGSPLTDLNPAHLKKPTGNIFDSWECFILVPLAYNTALSLPHACFSLRSGTSL